MKKGILLLFVAVISLSTFAQEKEQYQKTAEKVVKTFTEVCALDADQQKALLAASKKAEAYYLEEAKKQDANSVDVFRKAGVKIATMTPENFNEWRALAQETSYKQFLASNPDGKALLEMALSVD